MFGGAEACKVWRERCVLAWRYGPNAPAILRERGRARCPCRDTIWVETATMAAAEICPSARSSTSIGAHVRCCELGTAGASAFCSLAAQGTARWPSAAD
jgi:hypothetical protein